MQILHMPEMPPFMISLIASPYIQTTGCIICLAIYSTWWFNVKIDMVEIQDGISAHSVFTCLQWEKGLVQGG